MKLAFDNGKSRTFRLRRSLQATTRRSGSRYGSARSSTALVTLKMAVLAPTPKAMVSAAVKANTGLLRNTRAATARSRKSISHLRNIRLAQVVKRSGFLVYLESRPFFCSAQIFGSFIKTGGREV